MAATKSKTKTPVERPPTDTLGRMLDQHHAMAEAAESILMGCISPEDLSLSEINVLRQAGIEGHGNIGKEFRRAKRAARFMEEAGGKAEFEADKKALAKAEAVAASRGEELRLAIEKAQVELDGIDDEAKRLAAIVATKAAARVSLMELAPLCFQEESSHMRRQANERHQRDVGQLRNRLLATDKIQSASHKSNWAVRYARGLADDHPAKLRLNYPGPDTPKYEPFYVIDELAWADLRKEMIEARPEVEKQLAKAESLLKAAREKAKGPLRYYAEKFGI